ncbi:MAG: hypothetical protein EBW52_09640 [Betaproteobacteria bacterium]|nr:hypothetical protein [Betaproteobacteria bacterium]
MVHEANNAFPTAGRFRYVASDRTDRPWKTLRCQSWCPQFGDQLKVLEPGSGKTRTGRLWSYVRDERPYAQANAPAVWFAYSADRKGEHPQKHLKDFRGCLQADAYSGFAALYRSGKVIEAGCWAHARRGFMQIHSTSPSAMTTEVLAQIAACDSKKALRALLNELPVPTRELHMDAFMARSKEVQ